MPIAPLQDHEFKKIRDLIIHACGIALDEDKGYLVESRLTDFGNELKAETFSDLHRMIVADSTKLLPRVVDLMTTNETFWFRDDSLWNALEERIIPDFFTELKKAHKGTIRILSAACSTGQEPYSLSMLIQEIGQKKGLELFCSGFSIVGADISNSVLFLARAARYNILSVRRGLSDERLNCHFIREEKAYRVKDETRNRVQLQHLNLMDSVAGMGPFDLILCRNVAIYFTLEFKSASFKKLESILTPKGLLVVGASESLLGISHDFEPVSCGNAVYYRTER